MEDARRLLRQHQRLHMQNDGLGYCDDSEQAAPGVKQLAALPHAREQWSRELVVHERVIAAGLEASSTDHPLQGIGGSQCGWRGGGGQALVGPSRGQCMGGPHRELVLAVPMPP